MRILLAQELGMGYWHAVLLARVASAFADAGAEVVAAVPDPGLVAAFVPPSVRLVAAPFHVPPDYLLRGLRTHSFADILGAAGWSDARLLAGLVRAWDGLAQLARAAAIVVDHAPTALLALAGRAPTLHLGLGFTTPPTELAAFPALVATPPVFAVEQLLAAAQAAAGTVGRAPPATLPASLQADLTAITTLLELDPYRALRGADAVHAGPLEALPRPSPVPIDGPISAYLAGDDPRTDGVLLALLGLGRRVDAHVRGAAPEAIARWERAGLTVARQPLDWAEAVGRAALVVHHGGAGSCHVAAAAGRPQLLLPRHLEQVLNARALAALGVAATVDDTRASAGDAAAQLLSSRPQRAAQQWAAVVAGNREPAAAEALAAELLARLGSR